MSAKTQPTKLGGRVGIVGTGHRALLYTKAIAVRPSAQLVALCDVNEERMRVHQQVLKNLGKPEARTYRGESIIIPLRGLDADFHKMLKEENLDALVVTTIDATHDRFIVPALKAGIRVLTEKPMTIDVERCQNILKAVEETNGSCQVLFNYRYNPAHCKIGELIAAGKIGNVKSVHFEWLLDTVHGADYFRRWHRYKNESGGLMVHKASHHFDLVNFWINAKPKEVFGMGSLAFYGSEQGKRSGWARNYYRARGSNEAADDPFAIHLEDQEELKALYADTEHIDNYHRDMNVFAEDITIEDDMAVLVKYSTGATMTYHLTAYSPWEGYRVMFNGDKGRLELEVVESTHREAQSKDGSGDGVIHGTASLANEGHQHIRYQPLWGKMEDVTYEIGQGGHGGGDDRMLDQIFGPRPGYAEKETTVGDLSADQIDGALAMAVGLAANESFRTGKLVKIDEFLGMTL